MHEHISRLGTGLGWYLLEKSWTKDIPKTYRSPVTIIEKSYVTCSKSNGVVIFSESMSVRNRTIPHFGLYTILIGDPGTNPRSI